jgi:hypothetical protein
LKVRQAVLTWWVIVCGFLMRWMAELHEKLKPAPQGTPSAAVNFWRLGRWIVLAFLLLSILLLPMHYGAVALGYATPALTALTLSDGGQDTQVPQATAQDRHELTLPLLLLRDDAEFLTLYNPRLRKILRLRRELVKSYVADKPQTMFPQLGLP